MGGPGACSDDEGVALECEGFASGSIEYVDG